MKPPKSKMAELGSNATGGEKSHAEAKCARAEGVGLPECEARAAKRSQEAASAEFKMTELGPIPVDWEVKRLGDFCSKIGSGSTPIGGSAVYLSRGTSFIRSQNVYNGYFKRLGLAFISELAASSLDGVTVLEDDVLLNITGDSVARCTMVPIDVLPARVSQHVAIIRVAKDRINPRYLQCYLTSPSMQTFMLNLATGQGGSRNALTKGMVADFQIPLPPLAEQRRIAGALSDVDELISALGKLIEKKRNIKTGAMQELLTGKTRLPGFKGNWVERPFCEFISRFATGLNPRQNFKLNSGGNNYYITIKDFKNGKISFNGCDKIDDLALRLINERSDLRAGDLLFSSIGRVGDAYVIKDTPANWNINESVFSLRPDESQMDVNFLYYLVKSNAVQERLTSGITGSTLTGIKIGELRGIVCFYPSDVVEQKAIAAVLSDMDAEIAALEADRAKYERIKSGMMQELLTGKTRLLQVR